MLSVELSNFVVKTLKSVASYADSGNLPSTIPETEVIPVIVISFNPTDVTRP